MKKFNLGINPVLKWVKHNLWKKEILFFFLTLSTITVIFYAPWQSLLEKLDDRPLEIQSISGNPLFTKLDDIEDAIHKMGGLKGYFGQDMFPIIEQLKQLPWVENVVAHKKWPHHLSLWIKDYLPVAKWNENYYLSKDGVIFSLPADKISATTLPILMGSVENIPLLMNTWKKMFPLLKSQHLTLVALHLAERGAWTATLDNGIVLKLGRGDWQKKIQHFALIYPSIEVPAHQKIAYIDLRYPTGAAIKFISQDSNQRENK